MKQHLLTTITICLILTATHQSYAQGIVPAVNPDPLLTNGSAITDAHTINCDMIYHQNGSGTLRAIAYDDYNTGDGYVYLEDYAGNTTTITIPGGISPDIVLGDDMSNQGNDYVLGIVYGNGFVNFDTYIITGTGGSGLTATFNSTTTLPPTNPVLAPHIDLCPDLFSTISGIPSLHTFAITWTEYIPGGGVYIGTGDLGTPTSVTTTQISTTWGDREPDVACYWDVNSNNQIALVAYLANSNNDIRLVTYDIGATTFGTSTLNTFSDRPVRIEAMNQYDPLGPLQQYEVLYTKVVGTQVDIFSSNNLTGNTNLTGGTFSPNIHIQPAVAAGPGPLMGGGYGNDNYTDGWLQENNGFYYTQATDVNTGAMNGSFFNFYEANMNAVPNGTISMDSHNAALGISSSSNTGGNELLTAWVNNYDVYYKYNGDISQYKPTNINRMPDRKYKLYPNPASSELYIEGVAKGSYTVTDMAGRILMQGTLNGNSKLNISALSAGIYIATLTENGVTRQIKFARQ